MSSPDCDGCNKYVKLFLDTYAGGGMIEQEWSAPGESVVRYDERPSGESFVTTQLVISPGTYRPSRDEPVRRVKGSKSEVTFALTFDDQWTVTQFGTGGYE